MQVNGAMRIATDANTETNVLDNRRWGVTVIGPMKMAVYLCIEATSDNKAVMELALSCAREPHLPRLSSSPFNQSVFTLPQAWMSLCSPLTMGIRSETHHASLTHTHPATTIPHTAWGVEECVGMYTSASGGVSACVCVCVCFSLKTLISHR